MSRLADSLAYVEITGSKKFMHIRTRIALMDFANISPISSRRLYDLTDEGKALLSQSKVWKLHQSLLAQGFEYDANRKATPRFIPYRHRETSVTKSGREFNRVAWISSGRSTYAELPSETTASGWAPSLLEAA